MRGTGTYHFAVSDVFVPTERTVLQADAPLLETGPLFQIPRTLLFRPGDAAVALAVARSRPVTFTELANPNTPPATQPMLRPQPVIHPTSARAAASLGS